MSTALQSIRAACTAHATYESPLGPLLFARTAHGLAGIWFDDQAHHPGPMEAPEQDDDALLLDAAAQLGEYFTGRRRRFTLPLDLLGTPFQRRVWQALCGIEAGHTRSYGDIARELSMPQAMRAVGAAVGRNPVSVIVPCHRVLGTGGGLTGYAGGLARKRALLAIEGIRA
jgi:methylated-DNA-[protein]-cysteine S-methyltransferase